MKFHYNGPASGVTLEEGNEVLLWPNMNIELPEDNSYVKTLLALNYLVPVEEAFNER
ncbi:MAG: hypothetical protein ACTH5S_12770 [Hafnia alvei]|uniref:hypothetical protein n=1 Tax=Hafnia alvei TaxID=569 RepID=UPI000E0868D4|nr:hypothetical protein [Hafnia alvei]STQ73685.1 Uncharacterised protein [Hafnia alvei]